ncbi:MAG: hypothetical protein ACRC2V_12550 [Xenococcaceae cyanobacterium]
MNNTISLVQTTSKSGKTIYHNVVLPNEQSIRVTSKKAALRLLDFFNTALKALQLPNADLTSDLVQTIQDDYLKEDSLNSTNVSQESVLETQIQESVLLPDSTTVITSSQVTRLYTIASAKQKLSNNEVKVILKSFGYLSAKTILQSDYVKIIEAIENTSPDICADAKLDNKDIETIKDCAFARGFFTEQIKKILLTLGFQSSADATKADLPKILKAIEVKKPHYYWKSDRDACMWAFSMCERFGLKFTLPEIEEEFNDQGWEKFKGKWQSWEEKILLLVPILTDDASAT